MPKDNSKAARERRQKDAAERQAARDKRTVEQQIHLVGLREGDSKRELDRLIPLAVGSKK